jgi:hypothetical protein
MLDQVNAVPASKRVPWNKVEADRREAPLRRKHVSSIWTKLQTERRPRDLAMFNLAFHA